jgi:hypothetical protein
MENPQDKKCGCPCHKAVGLFILLIGITFLLGALGVITEHTVSLIWPVFVILLGLKKLAGGMCKCCTKA